MGQYGCKCGCNSFKEHIGDGPFIAAAARPTSGKSLGVHSANVGEKWLEKDKAAFKSMRQQGIQPEKLRGAHEMMTKAKDVHEIESGQLMSKKQAKIEKEVKAQLDANKKKAANV